jgi:hypothetical protein
MHFTVENNTKMKIDKGKNIYLRKKDSDKAELLQLKLTPIICLMNFFNKKVGNLKN